MAAPDSTKLQVNFKLADGTLINLYANSAAELEANLQSISDLAQTILQTGGVLSNGSNMAYVAKAFNATVIDEPVWAPSTPPAPTGSEHACKHGPMTLRTGVSEKTGKPWRGYFCPTPKGTPDQCEAKFVR